MLKNYDEYQRELEKSQTGKVGEKHYKSIRANLRRFIQILAMYCAWARLISDT